MKKIHLLLITGILISVAACSSTEKPASTQSDPIIPAGDESIDTDTITNEAAFFDLEWDDTSLYSSGLVTSEQAVLDHVEGMTVYRINLSIDETLNQIEGRQQVLYTNSEDAALESIYLRMYANLFGGRSSILELTADGEPAMYTMELEDSAVRIDLAQPLEPGERIELDMAFDLEVPQEMGGNYGLFSSYDNRLLLHVFYPVIPVYDDEGWNVEIPPEYGDVSFFDAALYIVRVEAPAGLVWVTSGVELGFEKVGELDLHVFAAGPARDFYMAASPNFEVMETQVGETRIRSFAFANRSVGAEAAMTTTAAAVQSYNARFGPYPYTEFDIVGAPMEAWGMEYPGATAISDTLYDTEAYYGDTPALVYLEGTVAHEVAHQWFFNLVGSDQVDEPWMDKALVQYATGLYFLDQYGSEGYDSYRESWIDRWNRLDQAPIPIGEPVSEYPGAAYSAIIYGRGPLFVEALAREMGQDGFNTFIRAYTDANRWDTAYPAELRAMAEDAYACDLSTLFAEWVE